MGNAVLVLITLTKSTVLITALPNAPVPQLITILIFSFCLFLGCTLGWQRKVSLETSVHAQTTFGCFYKTALTKLYFSLFFFSHRGTLKRLYPDSEQSGSPSSKLTRKEEPHRGTLKSRLLKSSENGSCSHNNPSICLLSNSSALCKNKRWRGLRCTHATHSDGHRPSRSCK